MKAPILIGDLRGCHASRSWAIHKEIAAQNTAKSALAPQVK
jgi:hypothetical protein